MDGEPIQRQHAKSQNVDGWNTGQLRPQSATEGEMSEPAPTNATYEYGYLQIVINLERPVTTDDLADRLDKFMELATEAVGMIRREFLEVEFKRKWPVRVTTADQSEQAELILRCGPEPQSTHDKVVAKCKWIKQQLAEGKLFE